MDVRDLQLWSIPHGNSTTLLFTLITLLTSDSDVAAAAGDVTDVDVVAVLLVVVSVQLFLLGLNKGDKSIDCSRGSPQRNP